MINISLLDILLHLEQLPYHWRAGSANASRYPVEMWTGKYNSRLLKKFKYPIKLEDKFLNPLKVHMHEIL